jgi:NAD(P)-dependent dehydrogenase (short-subunit alcohol dehydrogenase family)
MDQQKLEGVLITGANAGIGKEVARQLAIQGPQPASTWRAGTTAAPRPRSRNSKY